MIHGEGGAVLGVQVMVPSEHGQSQTEIQMLSSCRGQAQLVQKAGWWGETLLQGQTGGS